MAAALSQQVAAGADAAAVADAACAVWRAVSSTFNDPTGVVHPHPVAVVAPHAYIAFVQHRRLRQ